MPSLEVYGFEDLDDAFRRIEDIPWTVTEQALNGMAEEAAEKIKSVGEAMGVRDPQSEVHILDKISKRPAKQTKSGGYQDITFSGSRRRGNSSTRNAEIAFVNEYGKRSQRARPFIGTAMNRYENQISAPAEEVVGDWIEKEFSR